MTIKTKRSMNLKSLFPRLLRLLAACGVTLLVAPVIQADLLTDGFDTPGAPPDAGRVWDNRGYIDNGWYATSGYGTPNSPSLWDITATAGGRLENPASTDPAGNGSQYTESESPAWQWWTNPMAGSSSATSLSLSFDYGTGTGDTLTAHLWAVQTNGVSGANAYITNNQGWINGNSGQNQVSSAAGYTPYNLLNASNAPSNASVSGALTGAGTFNGAFDLSTLGIPGVSTVGDIDTFFIAFAANEVGGGTTWVDNLTVAIPEPSSSLLMACGGLVIGCMRSRRLGAQRP